MFSGDSEICAFRKYTFIKKNYYKMQILLANAKMMFPAQKVTARPWSQPRFQAVARALAHEMAQLDVEELARQLDCSPGIAAENKLRYANFDFARPVPAIMAYNGQAYKHLRAASLTPEAVAYGQEHLWITCFLYGLLRPMDAIVPYRIEHCVALEATGDKPVNQFWRDRLTSVLIDSVKADDGILVHLSTTEYEHLFDWNRVMREVDVIQPMFYVSKQGNLKMQAVWAKSCRGAMVRFILEQRPVSPDELCAFEHEGFVFDPRLGDESHPYFVREDG